MTLTFTAVFEEAPEGGYTAFVEELPGAISQGETLEEARENLKEAIDLILECNREMAIRDIDTNRVIREPIVINR
jgi:predicted RNase H-like HicB family nuclease